MALSLAERLLLPMDNDLGTSLTIIVPVPGTSVPTVIDPTNPFFKSLGTNGRACSTCHDGEEGWTLRPATVQARFEATQGTDPLFRSNDGANSPEADVSTVEARRKAYSLLLSKGLIRIHMPMPANADFTLVTIDDPYGHATAQDLSLFRRPFSSSNLRFIADVMWDARESYGNDVPAGLRQQASHATTSHGDTMIAPSDDVLGQIVNFELSLYTAQITDRAAGDLTAKGGQGGPLSLSKEAFYVGVNDRDKPNFDFNAMRLFSSWEPDPITGEPPGLSPAQASIGRGERIFNLKEIMVDGLRGSEPVIAGCSSCHNAPNSGGSSMHFFVDNGVGAAQRRTPDLPLYTFRCTLSGEVYSVDDPGVGLITGKCGDIGRKKIPVLRGLASRAPYFHNGSAATLEDVVDFYDQRFSVKFSAEEKADLVAFLRAL